jgi:penicillin-binding protein 2
MTSPREDRPRFLRIFIPILIIVLAFVGIMIRLWYLQVFQYEKYHELSISNRIRLKTVPATRGMIFDRDGNLLVDNRPSFCAAIVPEDVREYKALFAFLKYVLQMDEKEIKKRLKKRAYYASFQPRIIKENCNTVEVARMQAHLAEFPGLEILIRSRRHYLYGPLASHLLGYIGEISQKELKRRKDEGYQPGDYIGKYGIERTFERELRGRKGGYQVEVDANGREIKVLRRVEPVPGHNIYLTISLSLQQKLETLMEGKAGGAVVIDPNSGEILAMVSHPNFDPNILTRRMTSKQWKAFVADTAHPLLDRTIQGTYPPGSTFKIVTASAGLEEGVIQTDTLLFCPGYLRFGRRSYRCWKKSGHGWINIHQAIVGSCDVFFYQVGLKLGINRLAFYAKAFGLGHKTGIALPNEKPGLIPDTLWKKKRFHEPWYEGETLSIAIGQGYVLATPLQMAMLMGSVANDGSLMRPKIVREIRNIKGKVIRSDKPEVVSRLPVSRKVLEIIKSGLWGVVNERHGTAHRAKLKDINVSGKTGTAQVVRIERKPGSKKKVAVYLKDHAWFVAYAPSEAPKVALSVIVEHGGHGGHTAAPIAGNFLRFYFDGPEIY